MVQLGLFCALGVEGGGETRVIDRDRNVLSKVKK